MQKKFLGYTKNLVSILIFLFPINLKAVITTPINTSVNELKLSESLELKLITTLEDECYQEDSEKSNCIPNTQLVMLKDSVVLDFSELIGDRDNYYSYFVLLKNNKYFLDLNNDGYMEFAIVTMLGERNPIQKVKIFSVYENSVSFYGEGKFYWEEGTSVFDIKPKPSK